MRLDELVEYSFSMSATPPDSDREADMPHVSIVPVAEVADASGPVQDRADVLGFDGLP